VLHCLLPLITGQDSGLTRSHTRKYHKFSESNDDICNLRHYYCLEYADIEVRSFFSLLFYFSLLSRPPAASVFETGKL
jgi:hypothetical protein